MYNRLMAAFYILKHQLVTDGMGKIYTSLLKFCCQRCTVYTVYYVCYGGLLVVAICVSTMFDLGMDLERGLIAAVDL